MKMRKICWSISNITSSGDVFKVTFTPKWLGTLFGKKEVTVLYKKDPDHTYYFGGGGVYYDQSGKVLGNGNWIGERIDQYLKSW